MIVGIDLGTTNCACAIFKDGATIMIPNSLNQVLTPSAVSIDDEGRILTGLAARERQSTHASQTATAFKRYMGTNRQLKLGSKLYRAEELSAFMLKSLKRDAEAFLGEEVTEAVITVPAYFNNKQRTATRHAGEMAGLKVERLINEPTAAALAYGLDQKEVETKFLVFDLGGGTFDVSILEIFEGIIEVRASCGDNRLGGEDFNSVLIDLARAKLGHALKDEVREDGTLFQKLREAAERTRRGLTTQNCAPFALVWKDAALSVEIDSTEFEEACADLVSRLRDPVLRSMRDAGLATADLSEIVLVGGATRMPLIRRTVTKMFGRFPNITIDPDEAVARGAAIQAALKARNSALSEVVLTDVSPFSLGVEVNETSHNGRQVTGIFCPIIERNCVVPASREHEFTTVADYQTEVVLKIYQGESRWVRDNVLLGQLSVPVPRARAGAANFTCRFSYDINGLLEVDVHVPTTNTRKQLVIADDDGLSDSELARRREALSKIKVHPRDTQAVQSTLARAGRCYEDAIGDKRAWIGQIIREFESILLGQDPRQCEQARVQLESMLDGLEGPTFL